MARYNTINPSTSVSAGSTTVLTSPNAGQFTTFTGTGPYAVTIADPTLFSGLTQTFFNGSTSVVTLNIPNGTFKGPTGSTTTAQVLPVGCAITLGSDGSYYYVVSTAGGAFALNGDLTNAATTANIFTGSSTISIGATTGSTTVNNNVQVLSLGAGTAGSGTVGEIRATNQVSAYYSSDRRLKENITNITNALDKVEQLNGVEYDWTEEYIKAHGGEDGYFVRKHDIGLIAQEVEKVLPEIVAENNEGFKAIKYERIVALLIEAVKDLNDQIKELKGSK
jgi:hypothetical protein